MDVRVVLLFHFLLGGGWTLDATELEVAEVETPDSDAPDSERDRFFHNRLAQRNQSRITQTSASPSSQGGRIGSLRQVGRHGWGKGSTQPVPAIIEEGRHGWGKGSTQPVPAIKPVPAIRFDPRAWGTSCLQSAGVYHCQLGMVLARPPQNSESHPRVESSGASSSLGYTMPPIRWVITASWGCSSSPSEFREPVVQHPVCTGIWATASSLP